MHLIPQLRALFPEEAPKPAAVDASVQTQGALVEETPPVQAVEASPPPASSWKNTLLMCAGVAIVAFALLQPCPPEGIELDMRTVGILQRDACEQIALKDLLISPSQIEKAEWGGLDSGRLYCSVKLRPSSGSVLENFEKWRCRELDRDMPWIQMEVPIERFTPFMRDYYSRMKEFCKDRLCQVRFYYPGDEEELPRSRKDDGPACKT